jgi:hypothetical protein
MFGNNLVKSTAAMVIAALTLYADSGSDLTLYQGTPVRIKINRTVSSADAQEGDNVDFTTLDDVKAGDTVVIPRGSIAMATVTQAVPKRHLGKGGKLGMNIDYVRLPNGQQLPLRGVQDVKGGGHTGAMAGAMVATAIVFWPAAPLFLLVQGKDITIPEGHEVTVYTNSDYKLPPAPDPTTQMPSRPASLHNADILALKQAGFSDEIILAKVKSTLGVYEIGTTDLLKLKAAGVSQDVIAAMIAAPDHY